MDITKESAAAAADQAERLRNLCVAVHYKCRADGKHLDALLEEVNRTSRSPSARAKPSAKTRAQEEAKESLLGQRVSEVVKKLQPTARPQ